MCISIIWKCVLTLIWGWVDSRLSDKCCLAYLPMKDITQYEYWLSGFSFSPTKPSLWPMPCSPLAYNPCKNFPGIELVLDIENLSLDLIRPDDCTPNWTFVQELEHLHRGLIHLDDCTRKVKWLWGNLRTLLPVVVHAVPSLMVLPPLVSHCLYTFLDLEKQM